MKAWIVSDLHLEFNQRFDVPTPADADVMICAGDILTKGIVPTLEWLAAKIPKKLPVIAIAGNHEYYGASLVSSIQDARAFATDVPNVYFLENESVSLDGIKFVGGTLWTDFRLGGRDPALSMFYAEHGTAEARINDYRRIKYTKLPYRKLKPIHTYRKHLETRDYIASQLRDRNEYKTVVITHHAPSVRSVDHKDRDDPLSACYASDLEDLIEDTQPSIWVHGHVHRHVQYSVGETIVIANPRGYPGERTGFDPGTVVEI